MLANTVTSLGLLLNIVGVMFVWRYGLPWNYVEIEATPEMRAHAWRARIGILLIGVGFLVQLIALWV
jgi:hypothetical protein